jgi:predicted extracellular nuclease
MLPSSPPSRRRPQASSPRRVIGGVSATALLTLGLGVAAAPPAGADPANARLNELKVNPPGTDNPWEYVELRGDPGTALTNLSFLSVEGDNNTNLGNATFVQALGSSSFGSNGLLAITAPAGSGATLPAATTRIEAPAMGTGSALQNDSNSFLLVSSTSPIATGTDLDTDNDGALDLPAGVAVVDAIGWSDGGAGDRVYGGAVLVQPSGVPDAATRFPNDTTASSAAAWYGGDLTGSQDTVTYSATAVSANFPVGGALTPGDVNAPSAVDQPVTISCGEANLATTPGTAASRSVTATDPDDRASLALTSVTPPDPGITFSSTPASTIGGTATGSLDVAATVPTGAYAVVLGAANDDTVTPQTASCTITVEVSTVTATTRIRDVQGARHTSPLVPTLNDIGQSNGQTVTNVPGVVTAVRSNGFFMEDPQPDADPATSEGIFVFTSSAPPSAAATIGNQVLVSGTAAEFRRNCTTAGNCGATSSNFDGLTITQIVTPTITATSGLPALPAAVVLGVDRVAPGATFKADTGGAGVNVEGAAVPFDPTANGLDFYESLEGMRVVVRDAVAVAPTANFGSGASANREIVVLPENGAGAGPRTPRGGIVLTATDANPERVTLGDSGVSGLVLPQMDVADRFSGSITAVVDYSFQGYKLLPIDAASVPGVVDGGLARETTALTVGADQLTVATLNAENLDPGDGSRFNDLASIVVNNLASPDIVALQEIQDDNGPAAGGVSAAVTLDTLVAAIDAIGPTYQWRQIDPVNNADGGEPNGNIRVAFLYRTDRGVSFVDRPGGTATSAVTLVNNGGLPELSFSPGRIAPTDAAFADSRKPLVGEFRFNGRTLFVVNNHFNSKGGDDQLTGRFQTPVLSSETQRLQQAAIVAGFVDQIEAIDPDANVLVLGDLNDFEFSAPLGVLEAAGLTTMIETLPSNERYSYNFRGNAQVLDHVMVSQGVLGAAVPAFDVVHVNSEFVDQVSDHDPSVLRLTFPATGCTILGTAGDNVLTGTDGADVICGLGGNDTINALGGDDIVYTGDGNDTIDGGAGADVIVAGGGTNTIDGGAGIDVVIGGDGPDTIRGGDDLDYILGQGGDDTIDGGGGDDVLIAGAGNDTVRGSGGVDYVSGGDGDDLVEGGEGGDWVQGDAGADRVFGDTETSCLVPAWLAGTCGTTDGVDVVLGGDGDDRLGGGVGDDVLIGGAGADEIGVLGADASGADSPAEPGADYVLGGDGADVVRAGFDVDVVFGGDGDDTLLGGWENPPPASVDLLIGDGGTDTCPIDAEGVDYRDCEVV